MNFNRYYIKSIYTDSEDYSYSDVSRVSIYSKIDGENSEYEHNDNDYNNDNDNDNDNDYNNDNDNDYNNDYNINRIRDMYDRNSLYTVPRPNTNDDTNDDRDDLYSIMDLYTQPYGEVDDKVIEPVMQLPLSPNQLMLMKRQWDKNLDMELSKSLQKQISSWPRFSVSSNKSCDSSVAPRNSHFSELSNKSETSKKSTKSSKSWKSFFSKFTKKSKKNQIKFYDNLVKQI